MVGSTDIKKGQRPRGLALPFIFIMEVMKSFISLVYLFLLRLQVHLAVNLVVLSIRI